MADAVTTSNAGSSSSSKKAKDDGTETITITVNKERGDEVAFQRALSQLKRLGGDTQQTIVGNLADLQRAGAAVANGQSVEEGFLNPPATADANTGEKDDKVTPQPLEDVVAPGPVSVGADEAEVIFGDRVAQGERPESK